MVKVKMAHHQPADILHRPALFAQPVLILPVGARPAGIKRQQAVLGFNKVTIGALVTDLNDGISFLHARIPAHFCKLFAKTLRPDCFAI